MLGRIHPKFGDQDREHARAQIAVHDQSTANTAGCESSASWHVPGGMDANCASLRSLRDLVRTPVGKTLRRPLPRGHSIGAARLVSAQPYGAEVCGQTALVLRDKPALAQMVHC
jgi:hypothetical protein